MRVLQILGICLGLWCLASSSQAQTVRVKYKKFIVPGETEYGRWASSPAMKRQLREREENMANNVAEYYTLYTDGQTSFFSYDTVIQRAKVDDRESWWSKMSSIKATQAKDLRKGSITHRSPLLADSICRAENFKEKYSWKPAEGFKLFAGLPCQKLVYETEDKDSIRVWYTADLPISDGPETFGGAPGLILAVEAPGFNYIAEEVEVGSFSIPKAPLPSDMCLEEKEFNEKMRTAAMKKFMKN